MQNRKQRVVLNGVTSAWKGICAGVPQGSVLGPLLFFIYINDLPNRIVSNTKLFADDVSIFSSVSKDEESRIALNSDLKIISDWAFQWKMHFNPDPNKQANEVVFSRKKVEKQHVPLNFNDSLVNSVPKQKHLGLILDKRLNFNIHIEEKITKANRAVGLLRKLYQYVPRKTLLLIYKAYIRPHLDYADVVYDQPQNSSFCNRLESVQYNSCLAITGAIRGTSRKRLYLELGMESLRDRRWYRKLVVFFKLLNGQAPSYLKSIVPSFVSSRDIHSNIIRQFKTNSLYFASSFFPYCIKEWNNLSQEIREISTVSKFKQELLSFIRPKGNDVFQVFDPGGLKLLSRLRLNLSHLREHKFNHKFSDTLVPLCSCGVLEAETTEHFLLRCPAYTNCRKVLLDDVKNIFPSILSFPDSDISNILLYGGDSLKSDLNQKIILSVITYLKNTGRFKLPLISNF